MGVKRLLDTNAVLYHLSGKLTAPLPPAEYAISIVSELELLSFPKLDAETEKHIRAFLSDVTIIQLNPEVCAATIDLRRRYRLKLPDAIIAGTAKAANADLITNDEAMLRIAEISTIAVETRP